MNYIQRHMTQLIEFETIIIHLQYLLRMIGKHYFLKKSLYNSKLYMTLQNPAKEALIFHKSKFNLDSHSLMSSIYNKCFCRSKIFLMTEVTLSLRAHRKR